MKDVKMAPTTKIRPPIKVMNCEKTADKPNVKVPEELAIPVPILLLKKSRNNVDATLKVNVNTTRVVWKRLRSKSLTGKL
jgi:hypothetical protein